jgi:hypothetical protein
VPAAIAPKTRASCPIAARPGGAEPDNGQALNFEPADGIGAFAGPAFDPDDIEAHLAAWTIKRAI